MASAEVEAVLTKLPESLREEAKQLPVTLERIPNAGLLEEGIETDTLGLFIGAGICGKRADSYAVADHFIPGKSLGLCGTG